MKQEELGNEQTANNNTNPPMHSSIHAVDNKSPQTSLPALPLQKNAKEMNDLKDIFPTAKIKAILRQEERIGRIYTSAVDILGKNFGIRFCLKGIVVDRIASSSLLLNNTAMLGSVTANN